VQANRSPDIARTTLQLLALGVLIGRSFWIVRPFLLASTWATMIVVATWPVLLQAQAWLGARRSLAVASKTPVLLLVLLVPLYVGIETIVENANRIADGSKSLATFAIPQPPAWVEALPLVGSKLAGRWQELATAAPEDVTARISAYARELVLWFLGHAGSIGLLLVQFLLTVIIAAILYANGEAAARGDLGLLDARRRMGNRLPPVGDLLRYLRQFSAPDAHQAGRRPAAAADLCGGDWWAHRLRGHRALHWSGGARGRLYAARRLGVPGHST